MHAHDALVSARFRYFAAVAEAGSMRAAARRLNIASSAVNRQILLLEEALGTPLFERAGRRLQLNEAGRILLTHVHGALAGYEEVIGAIDALKGLRRGTVRVATVESVSVALLPSLLSAFAERYPGISVDLTVTGSDDVTRLVLAGEADAGFTFNPASSEGLHIGLSQSLPIGVIITPGHALATSSKPSLAECLAHPYALPAPGLSLRTALDQALRHLPTPAPPLLIANSLRVMAALARSGRCIAFQTVVGIERHLESGRLVFRPLSDRALPGDEFMLIRRQGAGAAPAKQAFFDMALAWLPNHLHY